MWLLTAAREECEKFVRNEPRLVGFHASFETSLILGRRISQNLQYVVCCGPARVLKTVDDSSYRRTFSRLSCVSPWFRIIFVQLCGFR